MKNGCYEKNGHLFLGLENFPKSDFRKGQTYLKGYLTEISEVIVLRSSETKVWSENKEK